MPVIDLLPSYENGIDPDLTAFFTSQLIKAYSVFHLAKNPGKKGVILNRIRVTLSILQDDGLKEFENTHIKGLHGY